MTLLQEALRITDEILQRWVDKGKRSLSGNFIEFAAGIRFELARTMWEISTNYYEDALNLLQDARQFFEIAQHREAIAQCWSALADLYEAVGDTTAARAAMSEAIRVGSS